MMNDSTEEAEATKIAKILERKPIICVMVVNTVWL